MYEIAPLLKDRMISLVKFSDEKWTLESLQNGTLYLNTLEYFRKLEKETNERGMGDDNEGRLILTELNIKMYDNENEKLILSGKAKSSAIKTQEDSEKHVLCTSYIDFGNLEIIDQGKDYFKSNIIYTEEQKAEFKKHFGKYALIISFTEFVNNINDSFKTKGIEGTSGKVKYSDFSINYMKRLDPFIGNTSDKYLWKDLYFKNQKEYRLTILNRDSEKPIKIQVGDMSNYSAIITSDELFNNELIVESHFNPETDTIKLE
ncbi:hypothetical protein [Clostridium estertheticum]|uniref:hypothetical protein n=1 Tax=Clostridium estertheticum TaxID=238834 RepID=UPI001C0DC32E|nr:hypothetical protein [Clostridium estertheticum]MBU3075603.1 hypothetical protein [Clostridium estertheticum]MBU3164815.1 hypothetical protein [Clostridium estertheticum]